MTWLPESHRIRLRGISAPLNSRVFYRVRAMALHKSKELFADRCPIRDVLERLGDRWTMLVLFTLEEHGMQRFSVLRRNIPDISQRMLAQTLRTLEQDGLISRAVHPTVPPRVDYALTPLGVSFLQPMHGLLRWAADHHEDVRAARTVFRAPLPAQAL